MEIIKSIQINYGGKELSFPSETNHLAGKRVAIYGGSYATGYPQSNDRDNYSFVSRAVLALGGIPMNYGVNNGSIRSAKADGSPLPFNGPEISFTRLTSPINYQNSMLDIIDDIDVAVFLYGHNDYAADNSDIDGGYNDFSSRDTTKFLGAYNFVLKKLFEAKKGVRVALLTSFSNDYPNLTTGTGNLYKFNKLIEEIGNYWCIPVLSVYKKTCLFYKPDVENFNYHMTDRAHPATTVWFNQIMTDIMTDFLRYLV